MMKAIMSFKKSVGEFSMDLYYNNLENEFVCKFFFPYGEKDNKVVTKIYHVRNELIGSCLIEALEFITRVNEEPNILAYLHISILKKAKEMKRVNDLMEAMEYFLKNSSGKCICVKHDGTEKECSCYPEAKQFYEG